MSRLERLRTIAQDQLEDEGFYTQAEEVREAAEHIESLERLHQDWFELNTIKVRHIAKLEERIAELKQEIAYWEKTCKGYSEADKRIAELEGALREIADIDAGKGLPSSEIARAALEKKGPTEVEP